MTPPPSRTGASGSAGSNRPARAPLRPASVPARMAAGLVDLVVGALAAGALMAVLLYGARQPLVISAVAAVACTVLVRGLMLAATGWSPGGRVAGVRMVGAQDHRPSPMGVFLHADITFVVMLLTLGLGGIALMRSVSADPHKRGWHDRSSGVLMLSSRGQREQRAQEERPGRDHGRPAPDAAAGAGAPGRAPRPAARPQPGDPGHSRPRIAQPAESPSPGSPGPAPTTRTPEEPGRQDPESGSGSRRAARRAKASRSSRPGGTRRGSGQDTASGAGARGARRSDTPAQRGQAAPPWEPPTRTGEIGANPVTSQPMEARPAEEQPRQPRPEQASSPAAHPQEAQPRGGRPREARPRARGPVPQRESLFAADRYSFTASGSRHSDVSHTFDTASVLPTADRNTQALIDSVPWSSVPTSLDSTTMDSLPDQIRAAMEQDEGAGPRRVAGAPRTELSDTESLPPVPGAGAPADPASSASSASSTPSRGPSRFEPARRHGVNLLDPQEVPGAAPADSSPMAPPPGPGILPPAGTPAPGQGHDAPAGSGLPRSIAPASHAAPWSSQPSQSSQSSQSSQPSQSSRPGAPEGPSSTGASAAASPSSGSPVPPATSVPSAPAVSAPAPAVSGPGAPGGSAASPFAATTPHTVPSASPAAPVSPPAAPGPASSAAPMAAPSPDRASPGSQAGPLGGSHAASPAAPDAPSSHAAPAPSSAGTSHAASPAAAAGPAAPPSHAAPAPSSAGSSTRTSRAAQHRAADPGEQPGAAGAGAPRLPVPPTVEVPRVSRRRRAAAPAQRPTAMPPTMPRPSTANPPLSVRLVPMMGGDPLMIHEPTVVGRDPDNISDYPGAERISLSDPTRSVSKTHAAIFPLLDGVWVTDLHSTNGTRVENKDGSSTHATPEEALPAMDGSTIYFGRIGFRIEVI